MEPLWRGAGKRVFEDPGAQACLQDRGDNKKATEWDGDHHQSGREGKRLQRHLEVCVQAKLAAPPPFVHPPQQTDRQTDGHAWVSSQQWDAGWSPLRRGSVLYDLEHSDTGFCESQLGSV